METSSAMSAKSYHLTQVIARIVESAKITPTLTAIRFGDGAMTYGDLAALLDDYEEVLEWHGLSEVTALYAALLNGLPGLAAIDEPQARLRAIDQALDWLGRGLPEPNDGASRIRAIG